MAWPNVYGLDASKFQPHASTPPQRSTIVLIHDAFHTPEHFEPLATELISSGWRVLTPRLPSSGTGQQEAALEADVQAISAAAGPDMASGRNLVLVMHGYSSIPGSMAANRLDRYSLQRPRAGHVVKLIFFAGIIVNRNESFEDVFRASWLSSEGNTLRAQNPIPTFYQDCAQTTARIAASHLQLQARNSFQSKVPVPGWDQIPCQYVILELDNAVPITYQRHFAQKLRLSNGNTTASVMQASHSPFLSRARETSALIVIAANAI